MLDSTFDFSRKLAEKWPQNLPFLASFSDLKNDPGWAVIPAVT